jgi:pyruvate dehydrogenase E1 component alpha subunit
MKEVTKEVYLKWYEDMLLWRKFEDKLAALYIQTKEFSSFIQWPRSSPCRRITCNGLNKDKMIKAYRFIYK